MHKATINSKKIELNSETTRILQLFEDAYKLVLSQFQNTENSVQTGLKADKEQKKESESALIEKAYDIIKTFVGIDFRSTERNLPLKQDYFEPISNILRQEYHDFLNQVLLKSKRKKIYPLTSQETISDKYILMSEILLRLAHEILQFRNENERDGIKVLKALEEFIETVKRANIFSDKNGRFSEDAKQFFREHPKWVSFFKGVVDFVKQLNANETVFTEATAYLTQQKESLMSIIVAKYLTFLRSRKSNVENLIRQVFTSLDMDLSHVHELSTDHLSRTLLNLELEVYSELWENPISKEEKTEYRATLNTNHLTVTIFSQPKILPHQNYIIEMLKKYSNDIFDIDRPYQLLKKTNQLIKILEKLSSLMKLGGWFLFISRRISLENYKTVMQEHSKECLSFIKESINAILPSEKENKGFKVFEDAIILFNRTDTFSLNITLQNTVHQLDMLSDKIILDNLSDYFRKEVKSLHSLQKSIDCHIINSDFFQKLRVLESSTNYNNLISNNSESILTNKANLGKAFQEKSVLSSTSHFFNDPQRNNFISNDINSSEKKIKTNKSGNTIIQTESSLKKSIESNQKDRFYLQTNSNEIIIEQTSANCKGKDNHAFEQTIEVKNLDKQLPGAGNILLKSQLYNNIENLIREEAYLECIKFIGENNLLISKYKLEDYSKLCKVTCYSQLAKQEATDLIHNTPLTVKNHYIKLEAENKKSEQDELQKEILATLKYLKENAITEESSMCLIC